MMEAPQYQQIAGRWETLLNNNQLLQAIEEIQDYIEIHSANIDQFYGVGNIFDREEFPSGNYIKWYYEKRSVNKQMDNPYDLLSVVASCLDDCQPVIDWYKKMIDARPNCYQLHHGLANAYFNTFKSRQSEKYYQQALKICPELFQAYVGLALIEVYRYLRFYKALAYAEKALSINGDSFQAKLIKAGFHPSKSYSFELIKQLKQKYPDNSLVLCAQGYRLVSIDYEKTQEIYKQVVERDPNCIIAYLYLSKMLRGMDIAASRDYLQKGLKISPKSHFFYFQLGQLEYNNDNYTQALSYLQKSLNLNAEDCVSLYFSGYILWQQLNIQSQNSQEKIATSIKYLKKSIVSNPYYMRSYSQLKKIYKTLQMDEQQSQLLFDELKARLDSNNPSAIDETVSLVIRMLKMKQYSNNKRDLIFQIIESCQQKVDLALKIADQLLQNELASESLRYIKICLEDDTHHAYALHRYATALRFLERWEESVKYYISYLEARRKKGTFSLQSSISRFLVEILKNIEQSQAFFWLEKLASMFEDCLTFSQGLADYYQKANRFDLALQQYTKMEEFDFNPYFEDQDERDQFFGQDFQKWRKLNSKGVYPKRQQLHLKKLMLQFKQKFYLLYQTS